MVQLSRRAVIGIGAAIVLTAAAIGIYFYMKNNKTPDVQCDPTNPLADCYDPNCDPTDPKGKCYNPGKCDASDPKGKCYDPKCDPTDPKGNCYHPKLANASIAAGAFVVIKSTRGDYIIPGTVFDGNLYNQNAPNASWVFTLVSSTNNTFVYTISDGRIDHKGEMIGVSSDGSTVGVYKNTTTDNTVKWIASVQGNGITLQSVSCKKYLGGQKSSSDNHVYLYPAPVDSCYFTFPFAPNTLLTPDQIQIQNQYIQNHPDVNKPTPTPGVPAKIDVGKFMVIKAVRGTFIIPGTVFDGNLYDQPAPNAPWIFVQVGSGPNVYAIRDGRPTHNNEYIGVSADGTSVGVYKSTTTSSRMYWTATTQKQGIVFQNVASQTYLGGHQGGSDNYVYLFANPVDSCYFTVIPAPEAVLPPKPNYTFATLPKNYLNTPLIISDSKRNIPISVDENNTLVNHATAAPIQAIITYSGTENGANMYRIQFIGYAQYFVTDSNNQRAQLSITTDASSVWVLVASTVCSSAYVFINAITTHVLGVGGKQSDYVYMYPQGDAPNNIDSTMCFTLTIAPPGPAYVPSNAYLSNFGVPATYAQIGNNTRYIKYLDHRWTGHACAEDSTRTPYQMGQVPVPRINQSPDGVLHGIPASCLDGNGNMQGTLVASPGWVAYQSLDCQTCPNVAVPKYDASWQAAYEAKVQAATVCQPCPPNYEAGADGLCQVPSWDVNTQNALRGFGFGTRVRPDTLHSYMNMHWSGECKAGQNSVDMSKVNTDIPRDTICAPGWKYDSRNGFDRQNPKNAYCVPVTSQAQQQNKQISGMNGILNVPDGRTVGEIYNSLVNPGYIPNWPGAY